MRPRIEPFIDETTGKLISLKMSSVILENVWCQSRYQSQVSTTCVARLSAPFVPIEIYSQQNRLQF